MNPEGTEVDVHQGGCPLINADIPFRNEIGKIRLDFIP